MQFALRLSQLIRAVFRVFGAGLIARLTAVRRSSPPVSMSRVILHDVDPRRDMQPRFVDQTGRGGRYMETGKPVARTGVSWRAWSEQSGQLSRPPTGRSGPPNRRGLS